MAQPAETSAPSTSAEPQQPPSPKSQALDTYKRVGILQLYMLKLFADLIRLAAPA